MLTFAAFICTALALSVTPLVHVQLNTESSDPFSSFSDPQLCDHRGSGRRDVGQCS
ncbi:MAG TPA: hypothetical protein ACFE0H_03280 [Elainellaceae cyanobacterium]